MLELQADTSPPGMPVVDPTDPKHTAKVNKDQRGLISTPWSVFGIHEEADGSEEARRSVLPSPRCLEEPPCWEPVEVRRTDGFSQAKAEFPSLSPGQPGRNVSFTSVLLCFEQQDFTGLVSNDPGRRTSRPSVSSGAVSLIALLRSN